MPEDATTAAGGDDGSPTRRHRRPVDLARIRARTTGVAENVVRWFGSLAALLMLAHAVLTAGQANPDNGITQFVAAWAQPLALGFADLFAPSDPRSTVAVNYGTAALFWLLATSLAVRIIRSAR